MKSDAWTAKRDHVLRQMQQASASKTEIECRCGQRVRLWMAFRCLYCGEYFCKGCAEEHYGKSRAEYLAEHPEVA